MPTLTSTTRRYRYPERKTPAARRFQCVACGKEFGSLRPPDANLPVGYGRCVPCRPEQVLELVQMGLNGRYMSKEQAEDHISRHA